MTYSTLGRRPPMMATQTRPTDMSKMQQSRGQDHTEGPVARAIEQQTAKLPSDLFLWAALGSIGVSLFLQCEGKKVESNFVGQWAPTFLLLGLYNKIVK